MCRMRRASIRSARAGMGYSDSRADLIIITCYSIYFHRMRLLCELRWRGSILIRDILMVDFDLLASVLHSLSIGHHCLFRSRRRSSSRL